jgi:hypothetical protein
MEKKTPSVHRSGILTETSRKSTTSLQVLSFGSSKNTDRQAGAASNAKYPMTTTPQCFDRGGAIHLW